MSPPPITADHKDVIRKLNQDGMLRIPEVRAKSDSFLAEAKSQHVRIEVAAHDFNLWLTEYASTHPGEVAKAKAEVSRGPAMPLPPGGPVGGPSGGNVQGPLGPGGRMPAATPPAALPGGAAPGRPNAG